MDDECPFTPYCREMMSEMQQDILTELRQEADTPYPDRIRLSDVIARYYDKMLYIVEILRWLSGLQYDPEMWLPKPDDNKDEDADIARVEVPPLIITAGMSDEPTTKMEELGQQPSVMQEVLGQSYGKKSLEERESLHSNQIAQPESTVQYQIEDQSRGDVSKQRKILRKKNAKIEPPSTTQESDSETTVEDMKRYSRMSFLKTPTRFLAFKNLMPKHSKRARSTLEEIPTESTAKDKQVSEQKSVRQSSRNDKGDRTENELRSDRSGGPELDLSSESQAIQESIGKKYKKEKTSKDLSRKEEASLNYDIPRRHTPIHRTRRTQPQQSNESTEQEDVRRHKKKEGTSTSGRRRADSHTLPQASPRTDRERHYEETPVNQSKKPTSNKTM